MHSQGTKDMGVTGPGARWVCMQLSEDWLTRAGGLALFLRW